MPPPGPQTGQLSSPGYRPAPGSPAPPAPPGLMPPGYRPPSGPNNPFASDPGYAYATAAQTTGNSAAQAQLNSLIGQRIIGLGDPNLAKQLGIDPNVGAEAGANTHSQLYQLQQAHQLARQAILNRLAARGILGSGETGYDTGQEDQSYGNQVYDAQQKALSDILGYRQSELSTEDSLRGQVLSALQAAYANSLAHPELYPSLGGSQTPSLPAPAPSSYTASRLRALAGHGGGI